MEQLRVAFDMTFANRNRGGSMVYARSLFAALGDREDMAVWTIAGPSASNLPGTLAWLVRGAHAELSARPPEILHCPSYVMPWNVGVPIVVTAHDAAARRFAADHPLEWRVYDTRVMPGRLQAAARVITGSSFSRSELVDVYGVAADKVVVVPYGIEPRLLGMPLPAAGPARDGPILFPGAPIGRKNLEGMLDALAGAPDGSALGRASLEISGAAAADFPRHARRISELGLEPRVTWLGHVPAGEMPAVIRRAAVVAYPSLYEGFGFPPLEAMALGTPVVASNRGSLPEVLGDGAVLVEPDDGHALASALEAVLTRPELAEKLRRAGWARAQQFTWARCAGQTCDVYRAVLGERRAAA